MQVPDPAELCARIRAGDKFAEEVLYKGLSSTWLSKFRSEIGEPLDAEDTVQLLALRVITAIRADRIKEPDKILGYAAATARGLIADSFREQRRKPNILRFDSLRGTSMAPEQLTKAVAAQRSRLLGKLIKSHGGKHANALRLFFINHIPEEEIKLRFGFSSEQWKIIRFECKVALRREVESGKYCIPGQPIQSFQRLN